MLHICSSRRAHDLETYQSQQHHEEHGNRGERNVGTMHRVRPSALMPCWATLRNTPARHETARGMCPHVPAADRAHLGHAPVTTTPHPPYATLTCRPGRLPRDTVTNPLRPTCKPPRPGD